jgi:RNA-binding motif X-linked protein 2
MPRDPNTGKPRGFAWLMYADQRSTVLAVDNLNGAQVLGRTLRVDHVLNYKQLERDQETGKLKERDEQRYVDLQLVPLYRTDARSPISFAAHPEKFLKKAGESDGSESDSSHGSIDPDDPMRDYLISQRREKKKKRKAEGGGGGSSESKEEKRRRKEERRRIREEREARKARKGVDGGGKRRAIDDGGRGPLGSNEVKRSRGDSREREEERPSSRGPRSPDRYHRSDPRSRSRYSPDRSREERGGSRDNDRDRDRRSRYDDDDKRRGGGGGGSRDAFADLERWARGA